MATQTGSAAEILEAFDWQPQPLAAAFVRQIYDAFYNDCSAVKDLAEMLHRRSGTRLADWVDHYALPRDDRLEDRLRDLGFILERDCFPQTLWRHPGALFPPIDLHDTGCRRMAIKVESVHDFLARNALDGTARVEGGLRSLFRRAKIASEGDAELWAVERHGYRGWEVPEVALHERQTVSWHDEAFCHRKREFESAEAAFDHAEELIRSAVADLGAGWASDLFFSAERQYWTNRNRAAQFQRARQDALGLGWANHDHHTYRSSREHFARLVRMLELLGLECRERFYAGSEAGWGAQVLEQPESSIVVFADVDLGPDEVSDDFAHEPLAPSERLGTVGLWCKLHGEAFLQAGMHHLECQFDFDAAREQLRQAGIQVLKPFTDLPYLKQAFTQGETWPVEPGRVQAALAAGAITREQADIFHRSGAIGSHLEILQRDDGYKGFNKAGINEIIKDTDPRTVG
jgi:hypothetical protein